jgi:hypothetical protein
MESDYPRMGCSHVFGLFSLGGFPSAAMQPLWLLAMM